MKPTQKIINEVTAAANEAGINVTDAINALSLISMQMYKDMGAKSVVKAVAKVAQMPSGNVFEVAKYSLISETEKAILIEVPTSHSSLYKRVWVAKSLINNGYAPTWVLNK